MKCPTCASAADPGQQYCRTCGTLLHEPASGGIRPQMMMLIAVVLIFFGIIGAIAGDMAGLRWAKFAGVFIALGGMFSMIAGSLIIEMFDRRSPRRKAAGSPQEPLSVDNSGTTNKLLPPERENYAPTVVEDTTELLTPVERRREG